MLKAIVYLSVIVLSFPAAFANRSEKLKKEIQKREVAQLKEKQQEETVDGQDVELDEDENEDEDVDEEEIERE